MSAWFERYTWMRPREEQPTLERPLVDRTCPACGGQDVRRYPVACHVGPRIAVKCQDCLEILELTRPGAEDLWPAFRSVTYDWPASPAESASRHLFELHRPEAEK